MSLRDSEHSSMTEEEDRTMTEKPKRKARSHPYTLKLRQIKSNIWYTKDQLKRDDLKDEQREKLQNKVSKLEYDRFILKLNVNQKNAINKFCEYNKIDKRVEDIINEIINENR